MKNRILELEAELLAAIKIIDDGDRYSNNLEYIDSPYCAVVREFLFKHGAISEEERPKLNLESITEIKNENQQLQQDKAELVSMLEVMSSFYGCSLKDDGINPETCQNYAEAKALLEKHK